MLRRTPLRRTTPLRRRARLAARSRTRRPSSYRARPRDLDYMAWVRRQPCIVRMLPPDPGGVTSCEGRVEADHLGDRPLGRKADDRTCVPMCSRHHRQRHDLSGAFRLLTRDELRAWRDQALRAVHELAAKEGI